MRYYLDAGINEITREAFEQSLLGAIKEGKLFTVKGIAKDAFMLTIDDTTDIPVTDEQAGRLYANVISQIDSAIERSNA